MSQIVLASGSPRRKELLEQIGVSFEICTAKGEEHITKTIPSEVVLELSRQKAIEVASGIFSWAEQKCAFAREEGDQKFPEDVLVIGADTVVAYKNKILGKPKDEAAAIRMLTELSGKVHEVYTGVTLVFIDKSGRSGEYSFYDCTKVTMYELDEYEIRQYVASGDPMDKAGAYGIQGRFAPYIQKIDGDYYNVVGLPIAKLYQELKRLGFTLERSL